MACGAVSLRRHCPDQVPGGRRSACQLSGLSAFPPGSGSPRHSVRSSSLDHLADDAQAGWRQWRAPRAESPGMYGRTSWLQRKLRQRSGPVPGALYSGPGRQSPRPAPSSAQSGQWRPKTAVRGQASPSQVRERPGRRVPSAAVAADPLRPRRSGVSQDGLPSAGAGDQLLRGMRAAGRPRGEGPQDVRGSGLDGALDGGAERRAVRC